mmetsp:Transcript_2509/g.9184  ORF Transcript_2509/g.9184 Transcript_2509/m.9184 type:complete len:92 (-) Transcript_2509:341-616(-)
MSDAAPARLYGESNPVEAALARRGRLAFWGAVLLAVGASSIVGYAAALAKWARTEVPRGETDYLAVVPMTLPVIFVFVTVNWLSLSFFKYA